MANAILCVKKTLGGVSDVLKSAGICGVKSGSYEAESLCACGCGSKLDPRDFGINSRIDRAIYYVEA